MEDIYVSHVKKCFKDSIEGKSKITDDILKIDGMTGVATRHFYNNICSLENCRYLEIGVWKGSSYCSAMCNNKIKCTCIEDWSEFRDYRGGNTRNTFLENFNKFKGENDANFIENDSFKTNLTDKFNIYLYDGDHNKHYQALTYFIKNMDDVFIYIIDDWNWEKHVRNPTYKAIEDLGLKTIFKHEIFTPEHMTNGGWPEEFSKFKAEHGKYGDGRDWANGIGVFVLKK
jgi:hypothetical protein